MTLPLLLMKSLRSSPPWLRLAVAIMVGQQAVLIATSSHEALALAFLPVDIVLAVLLLLGSRIIWIFDVAGVLFSVPLVGKETLWSVVATLAVLACLLMPSSRRYIWDRRASRAFRQDRVARLRERYMPIVYGWGLWLVGERSSSPEEAKQSRTYGIFILPLGASLLILLILVGITSQWKEGAGHDSVFVDVLTNIVWIVYAIAQIAFLVLLLVAGYNYVFKRKKSTSAVEDG